MFAHGHGVVQSEVEAARWYRKAADQGNSDSQCSLGIMIAQGRDVAQSDVEAARWFRKAADQGHAHAKNKLGLTLT
jgi:hypothetical protein